MGYDQNNAMVKLLTVILVSFMVSLSEVKVFPFFIAFAKILNKLSVTNYQRYAKYKINFIFFVT